MNILWCGRPDNYFPHVTECVKHNPGYSHHFTSVTGPVLDSWRNADRMIVNWWKKNNINSDHLYIFEWDVYVNCKLIEHDIDVGVGGIRMGGRWDWWKETDRLPEEMRASAMGIVPLGVMYLHRRVLDVMASSDLYDLDIFSELRTGTIINHAGFKTDLIFPDARYYKMKVNGEGVFHSVKTHQWIR